MPTIISYKDVPSTLTLLLQALYGLEEKTDTESYNMLYITISEEITDPYNKEAMIIRLKDNICEIMH